MNRLALCLLLASMPASAFGQRNTAAQAARRWRQQHERASIDEYAGFLSIPNVASDRPNIRRNVDTLVKMMQGRGIVTKVLTSGNANPVVYGKLVTPVATRAIVFYAHYDGQPVNPPEWASEPFRPILRTRALQDGGQVIPLPPAGTPFDPESRLYARSSADDKVPIMAILSALDAIHEAAINARSTIRFVFEGEEEAGSPNLERILADNKSLVGGAMWLLCDSPTHPSRRQQIVFGAPSLLRLDINVYGANMELHGGHYGNWAPNPAFMLSRLLASMRDDNGHILIDHFYDDLEPLTDVESRALAEVPDPDGQLMREFGVGTRVGKPKPLAELVTLPVLNLKGLASAHVGAEAAGIVPAVASASLSAGPMKGTDYRKTFAQSVSMSARRASSSPTHPRHWTSGWRTRRWQWSPCEVRPTTARAPQWICPSRKRSFAPSRAQAVLRSNCRRWAAPSRWI